MPDAPAATALPIAAGSPPTRAAARPPVHDGVLRLPCGRTIGYADHGPGDGAPLLFFHGTPGARPALAPEALATAARLGVRLVAPERPGYGLSSPHAGRTLLSWADDVRALADHLRLERFAVAGASGGGPYAAACAFALPERVTIAGLVCTAGQFAGIRGLRALSGWNRVKFGVPRWLPWLLWADLALLAPVARRRSALLSRLAVQLSAGDRRTIAAAPGHRARLERLLEEAFRQGAAGVHSDLVLGSRDWGFDPRRITRPVHLWHGEDDRMAPPAMARALADALPQCTARFLPGVGHLILGHPGVWQALLAEVARAADAAPG